MNRSLILFDIKQECEQVFDLAEKFKKEKMAGPSFSLTGKIMGLYSWWRSDSMQSEKQQKKNMTEKIRKISKEDQ